jgi:hypothetical protein
MVKYRVGTKRVKAALAVFTFRWETCRRNGTGMDPASIATALVASQMGNVQMAVAAKMLRMNADNASAIVQVLDAAQKNLQSLANVAESVGRNLNVSA